MQNIYPWIKIIHFRSCKTIIFWLVCIVSFFRQEKANRILLFQIKSATAFCDECMGRHMIKQRSSRLTMCLLRKSIWKIPDEIYNICQQCMWSNTSLPYCYFIQHLTLLFTTLSWRDVFPQPSVEEGFYNIFLW